MPLGKLIVKCQNTEVRIAAVAPVWSDFGCSTCHKPKRGTAHMLQLVWCLVGAGVTVLGAHGQTSSLIDPVNTVSDRVGPSTKQTQTQTC